MIESSIVIPVHNKWNLTRNCLKSISLHTDTSKIEIIVIDNSSTDATQKGCSFLGKQLFGDAFHYIRNEINRNFAGASNQGAEFAHGEFIIFLNNDTEVQPGWYPPLINDFFAYPDIASTGPLLVYPDDTPFGRTVQHLGVYISPSYNLGHLYAGIPAVSPLARKRRFFQAITGACLIIRKNLFLEIGKFDERFINGFEDVDLCARLGEKGYRFTVNPNATVVHYESQTPGRHEYEDANCRLLKEKSLCLLTPDWHIHAKNDGLRLSVSNWLEYEVILPQKIMTRLTPILEKSGQENIRELLIAYPCWQEGWEKAMNLALSTQEKITIFKPYFQIFKNVRNAFTAYSLGRQAKDIALMNQGVSFLRSFVSSPDSYLSNANQVASYFEKIGLNEISGCILDWIDNYGTFTGEIYPEFARKFIELAKDIGLALAPEDSNAYAVWTAGRVPELSAQKMHKTSFSILMPVYNPKPEYLRAALDSVLAQDYGDWELCVADDASTNPEVRKTLEFYRKKDRRIRVTWREKNGYIAAATNTALAMAENTFAVLMDQDDTLSHDALSTIALAISRHPDALLFFSDEDKIDNDGSFFYPYFKNNRWDIELLAEQNYVSHLGVYRVDHMRDIGGFREGFKGSQDYDLLLRFVTGIDESRLVHIPRVLYHWRAHDDSTAKNVGVKSEAVDSANVAAQEWLHIHCPGAKIVNLEGTPWHRVAYPVPEHIPLTSIIHDLSGFCVPVSSLFAMWHNYWHPRLEHLLLIDHDMPVETLTLLEQYAEEHHGTRIVRCPNEKTQAERLNRGAAMADGHVLGFFVDRVSPISSTWFSEIISCLMRDNVGACAGKVIRADGLLEHAGYIFDANKELVPFLHDWNDTVSARFALNRLARTVEALDARCLFTHADFFSKHGGFNPAMGLFAAQDYCMKLGIRNKRIIWWPFAVFMNYHGPIQRYKKNDPAYYAFRKKWLDSMTPYNDNLIWNKHSWVLK